MNLHAIQVSIPVSATCSTAGERLLLRLAVLMTAGLCTPLPSKGLDVAAKDQGAAEVKSGELKEWAPQALKETRSKWAFEFGVGIIGDSTPGNYLELGFDRFDGPGKGLTYNLTAAYRLHEFNWKAGRLRLQPEIELPLMLTLVDQNVGGLIPDVNAGAMIRWRDFPWNRYVYTTFAAGAGISYSFRVWTADYSRHPGEDRSNLKFWLPIQFTIAAPQYPRHQLTLFIDHQSGGTILDTGGIDAWGFGYRFLF